MVHAVYCNEIDVGTATVDRQGLFYCICCASKPGNKEPYRILLHTDKERIDLGICPAGGQIVNRFSVKKIGEGKLHFVAAQLEQIEPLVKINENSQFPYLRKLPQAYLRQKDGIYCIGFKEPTTD